MAKIKHNPVRQPPGRYAKFLCSHCGYEVSSDGLSVWNKESHCNLPSTEAQALMLDLRKHNLRCRANQHKVYVWETRKKKIFPLEVDAQHQSANDVLEILSESRSQK